MRVVAAVLEDAEGRVLLAQRPPGKSHAGLWEFPGGKLEPGESAVEALRRELSEELGVEVERAARFMRVRRPRPGGELVLEAWRVLARKGEPHAHEHSALAWKHPRDALSLPLCEADVPICRALTLPAVYAISSEPGNGDIAFWLAGIEAGFKSGLRLVQLRAHGLAARRFRDVARELLIQAHAHDARLVVNSDVETALALGADGVHLTSERLRRIEPLPERPADFLVAASCHDLEELRHAARLGVDFVVLSPVCATASHPQARALGWNGFRDLLKQSDLPAYALGGMKHGDVAVAQSSGAIGIAGISAFW